MVWHFHTLTEDIQFSTFCAVHGVRIGYAPAEFYDEQPVTFSASWKQRMRWTKGFDQVFFTYGGHLLKSIVHFRRFAAYDLMMTIAPGMLLTLISILANGTFMLVGSLSHGFLATDRELGMCFGSILMTLLYMYGTFFCNGPAHDGRLSTVIFIANRSGASSRISSRSHCSCFPTFPLRSLPCSLRLTGSPRLMRLLLRWTKLLEGAQ